MKDLRFEDDKPSILHKKKIIIIIIRFTLSNHHATPPFVKEQFIINYTKKTIIKEMKRKFITIYLKVIFEKLKKKFFIHIKII